MNLPENPAQPLLDKFTPDEVSFIKEWLLAVDEQCVTPVPRSDNMTLDLLPPTLRWCAKLLNQGES